MDEAEIDSWYEEEKQKCLDEYMAEIETGKSREAAESRYNAKLNKAIEKYNKMMSDKLKKSSGSLFSKIK